MDEQERPVERETTIIHTGERSGSGGAIAAVVALVVIAVLAFLFFGGYFQKAADGVDVNVNVAAPNIDLPDIDVSTPAATPSNSSE